MKPSEALKGKEGLIINLVEKYGYSNPRVYGSTATCTDNEGSDLDLLVTRTNAKGSLLNLTHLEIALTELLGIHVDVKTEKMIPAQNIENAVQHSFCLVKK
jgi:predicted nucleotidyltransferase